MKKRTFEMNIINNCEVTECAYNVDTTCNARAITVGDGDTPHCDTFYNHGNHVHGHNEAGVGACKVSKCKYNKDLECTADSIKVGHKGPGAECLTFTTS
jgi:hypothetical protein